MLVTALLAFGVTSACSSWGKRETGAAVGAGAGGAAGALIENLRSLATSLAEYPDTALLIVGHTDATGSEAYNEDLSSRRANTALRFLSGRGVAMTRMHASGRGEWEPLATNETEAGRQANRRVEVAIYASEAARASL